MVSAIIYRSKREITVDTDRYISYSKSMTIIRIIGDLHGLFESYQRITKGCDHSIQVGDFGFGFNTEWDRKVIQWQHNNPNHRFIRGNHDNPEVCQQSPNCITDASVEEGVFFLGGAWSIDWNYRTPGIDWWFDEELNDQQLTEAIETYIDLKPQVVVSHDFPTQVSYDMFVSRGRAFGPNMIKTRTGEALQEMFEAHQPIYWFGGHWHNTLAQKINGTQFQCLNELDWADFNTDTKEVTYVSTRND